MDAVVADLTQAMPRNLLVTGPPRSGKTTVIQRVVGRLEDRGYRVGGVFSPERRSADDRTGFDIQDVMTGQSATLAAVDREDGPTVEKYRVDLDGLETITERAFPRARESADVIVVDEIAPMEVASDTFIAHVREALEANQPTLATVHGRSESGFIGTVRQRPDAELFEVTTEDRDALPARLTARLATWLES